MVLAPRILFLMFLLFITFAEGGRKKSKDKIVIHVPYKILKHHHIHTKYKVITIPEPKKENTIIYLKEEIQPTIKYVPQVQTHTEMQKKTPESFIPPHQASAPALLESLAKHREQSFIQTDQQEYSTIKDDQKPVDTHSDQTSQGFVPSFPYNPMMFTHHENVIPNFSFKPVILPKQQAFMPKLIINPVIHPSYEAYLPKFTPQPMLQLPQGYFSPKYMFREKLPPPKVLHDNVAHASEQVYKTAMNPTLKTTSYQVREDTEEDLNKESVKHNHTTLSTVPVPSSQPNRKGKSHVPPGQNSQLKNLIPSHPDYEYEHIGYLIIDGKSKKLVGKNFKDQIHLSK